MENYPMQEPPAPKPAANNGCWKWGAIGCVGLGCVAVIGFIALIVVVMNSALGKQAIHVATQAAEMESNMSTIKKGIDQYKVDKTAYPQTLKALYPSYINEERILHMNSDPSRPMYDYHVPEADSSSSSVILEGEIPPLTSDSKPVKVRMTLDSKFDQIFMTMKDGTRVNLPVQKSRTDKSD
ncbi:MAG: hypothetical protein ABJA67_06580 [Chthonomonadales bacterium]